MAVSTNHHKAAVGSITHGLMKAAQGPCILAIKGCQTNVTACLLATEICNAGLLIPYIITLHPAPSPCTPMRGCSSRTPPSDRPPLLIAYTDDVAGTLSRG